MNQKNIGQHYADVWKRHLDAMDRHAAAMQDVYRIEQETDCAMMNHEYGVFDEDDGDFLKEVREKGEKIFDRLVHYATEAFAPPGARLNIDSDKLHGKFIDKITGRDRDEPYRDFMKKELAGWHRFDPAAVWAALEKAYGGNKGVELGYQQIAKELANFFEIKPGQAVETKAGCIVLNVRVYSEKRYNGVHGLGYGSQGEVQKGLRHLAAVADWTDDTESAVCLRRYAERLGNDKTLASRERIDISENIEVVTFQSRFEFRFVPEFAQKLQEFISTYAMNMKNAA